MSLLGMQLPFASSLKKKIQRYNLPISR